MQYNSFIRNTLIIDEGKCYSWSEARQAGISDGHYFIVEDVVMVKPGSSKRMKQKVE